MKQILLTLLRAVVPGDWSDDVAHELGEAHARRAEERGRLRAGLWLWGQAVLFAARFGAERVRELRPVAALPELGASLARDVRLALRRLGRAPLFLGAVTLTLAVGIGANAAIFSVVRTVVLEPLPYPASDRLLVMDPNPWTPAAIVLDLERSAASLETVAGFYPRTFTVTGGDRPEELEGAVVTPDFLPLLGAEPVLGRSFGEADARPGAPPTALVSHGAWQRRWGGSGEVLGSTVELDGVPHTIVGVLGEGFRQLTPRTGAPAIWTAAALDRLGAGALPEGSMPWAIPLVRLRPGASPERAGRELEAATARHLDRHPEQAGSSRWELRWTTLQADLTEGARGAFFLLQAAVALVLLLACVNVANLLLVRLEARRGELAIRTALGAGAGRLLRQLLAESLVLSLLGGLAALALLGVSLEVVVALAPRDLPRIDQVSVDGPVLLFTLTLSVATGVLFGTLPGLAAVRAPTHRALREGGRTSTGSESRQRLSRLLVVVEVALTLVLVASAGLLVRSFTALSGQEPGFRTEEVLAVRMSAPEHRYDDVASLGAYQARLVERLEAVPGVDAVGLANNLPLSRGSATRLYVVEGETEPRSAQYGVVSPDYFEALSVPLLRGRGFEDTDRRDAPRVAVVDEVMAREAWPDRSPVGERFRLEGGDEWITVVGVSAGIRGDGLDSAPEPGFHIPFGQRPDTPTELGVGKHMVLLIRTGSGAGELAAPLRRAVWDVDPGQPVPEITPLTEVVYRSTSPERFRAILLAAFAAMALVLSVAGIYGVVGNLLAQRMHEFGIRRALGASGGDIVRTVLGWGLRLTALGVAGGLVGVLWLGRFLSSLLFAVESSDPVTLVAAVATVTAVALVACFVPAWRALRVDARSALGPG